MHLLCQRLAFPGDCPDFRGADSVASRTGVFAAKMGLSPYAAPGEKMARGGEDFAREGQGREARFFDCAVPTGRSRWA